MCFSTEASFTAGVVLTAIGVGTLKKAKSGNEIFFASIPLIFAAQQFTEGFLWLALTGKASTAFAVPATYIFLIFAQVIWPLWVPLAILKLEKFEKRKKILKLFLIMGVLVAIYNSYCLITYHATGSIVGMHISYNQDYHTVFSNYIGFFYVVTTTVSPFFSSIKRMWALSTAIFISYIVTTFFYEDYFVSVWCFFASVISITIYAVMQEIRKPVQKEILVT